jgi:cardiolipin synthase
MSEKREYLVPRWALITALVTILLVMVAFWSKVRDNGIDLHVDQRGTLGEFLPSIAGLARGDLANGNDVQVLQNGAFFDSLLRDIASAKQSVHFETFLWWKGDVCNKVAAALADRARHGVKVRLMLDASGGKKIDDDLVKLMESSGVTIARFHPLRFSNIGRMNNRDHRKLMIIDGRVGYIGGHGIAEEWTGNAQDKKHWRDTFVRLQGPVVNQLQAAFCENWIEETGDVPVGPLYFPRLPPAGKSVTHVSYSSPGGTVSSVKLLYYLAISAANKELIIQNPYFLPDDSAIEALAAAVKRGVNVSIMIPSADVNDSPVVQHASHHHYGTLLKRGVHVYEYNRTLLHQKIIIVDGVWSSVGSTNFDDRSFDINDEVSIGIYDAAIAQQLRAAYFDDLRYTTKIDLEHWKNRGFMHKLKDGAAWSINGQL